VTADRAQGCGYQRITVDSLAEKTNIKVDHRVKYTNTRPTADSLPLALSITLRPPPIPAAQVLLKPGPPQPVIRLFVSLHHPGLKLAYLTELTK